MARHIPRSHLAWQPCPTVPSCGIASPLVFPLKAFLKAENRCQKCDRIAKKLPPVGGRKVKDTLKYTIVLSHLTPEALDRLQRLAAKGKAGETIGLLINENTEQLGELN